MRTWTKYFLAICGVGFMAFGALSDTRAAAPAVSQVSAQVPSQSAAREEKQTPNAQRSDDLLAEDFQGFPVGVAVQVTQDDYPAIFRLFQERIAPNQARGVSTNTDGCDAGNCLHVVRTKGGMLVIVDRGDGAVHLFAYAAHLDEDPALANLDSLALSANITKGGVALLSVDEDMLAQFLGKDQNNATIEGAEVEANDIGDVSSSPDDLLSEELEAMPEDVVVPVTEDAYPRVFALFQGMLSINQSTGLSPFETTQWSSTRKSLHMIETRKGVIGILDRGDGAVHLLIFTADVEDPDLTDTMMSGLSLYAIITENGIEVVSMNEELLARFVGTD